MRKAFTLIEMTVVIAVIALLTVVAIPSVKALRNAFASYNSPVVINNLLKLARAIAIQHQRCAGIRFQQSANGDQYAIPIISEPNITYLDDGSISFRSVGGRQATNLGNQAGIASIAIIENETINQETTRVSIIFSPVGRLVRKWVMMRPNPNTRIDELFGDPNYTLFRQEDTGYLSDVGFVFYDMRKEIDFERLQPIYINPYMGNIIKTHYKESQPHPLPDVHRPSWQYN